MLAWLSVALADPGVWQGLAVQAPLHEPDAAGARLWVDAHARSQAGRFTAIVRPAIALDLGPAVSVFVGSAWMGRQAAGERIRSEVQVWEQVQWTMGRSERGSVSSRWRLEQRTSREWKLGLRARGMLRGQVNLPEPFALVGWNELFVGLNASEHGPRGLDQHRLFVGPAVRSGKLRAELGYLDQRVRRDAAWTVSPVFASSLFVTL